MRIKTVHLRFASMVLLLTFLPGAQPLPKWLQPKHVQDRSEFAPRGYSMYEPSPATYGGYQYDGYGPQPTIQFSPTAAISSSSKSSGELMSRSTVPAAETCSSLLSTSVSLPGTSAINLLTTGVPAVIQASPTGYTSHSSKWSSVIDSGTYNSLPSSFYGIDSYTTTVSYAQGMMTSKTKVSSTTNFVSSSPPEGSSTQGGTSEAESSTTLSTQEMSTAINETASNINTLTSIPSTAFSSGLATPSSEFVTTTNVHSRGYGSISATTTKTTVPPMDCNHNNCLRQFIKSSAMLVGFCSRYTATVNTATTELPTFVNMCHRSPMAISSACSCLLVGPTLLFTPSTASTSITSLASFESSFRTSSTLESSINLSSLAPLINSSTNTGSPTSPTSTVTSSGQRSSITESTADISMIVTTTITNSILLILTTESSGRGTTRFSLSPSTSSDRYTNSTTSSPSPTTSSLILKTKISGSSILETGTWTYSTSSVLYSSLPQSSNISHTTFSYTNSSRHSTTGGFLSSSISLLLSSRTTNTSAMSTPTSSTINLSTSALYTFRNTSAIVGSTGSGTYPITSRGILSTVMSFSISGDIFSFTRIGSATYTTTNTSASFGPTAIRSSLNPFSTGGYSSSYSIGLLSSGSILHSTTSGPATQSTIRSRPYPVSNSTLSVEPIETIGFPSSYSIQSSSSLISSISIYGPNSVFSSTVAESYLSSVSLDGGTFTSTTGGFVTSSAPFLIDSTINKPSSTVIIISSTSTLGSSIFPGSTLSTSYHDPGQGSKSTSREVLTTANPIPQSYYIPTPPPLGYYPHGLEKTEDQE